MTLQLVAQIGQQLHQFPSYWIFGSLSLCFCVVVFLINEIVKILMKITIRFYGRKGIGLNTHCFSKNTAVASVATSINWFDSTVISTFAKVSYHRR